MLSIIIVNHNSSEVLKECYISILSTLGNINCEIVVIDSGSKVEEIDKLMELRERGVEIILSKENIGYARAVNIGIKATKGDYLLISNPDILYLPGSIEAMLDGCKNLPQCGAVGPKTWWNRNRDFLLPLSLSITPYELFLQDLMKSSLTAYKYLLRRWIKANMPFWSSTKPLRQRMLSGACIMTTRKVIDRVGSFDEIFPLYFEDTDWSIRVRKGGYFLYMIPDAQIVHYYNQSAKKDKASSIEKFNTSMKKYLKKHFSLQTEIYKLSQKILSYRRPPLLRSYDHLGRLDSPPTFSFHDSKKKFLLLSPVDLLIPSACAFFEGDKFIFPKDLWTNLSEGEYFMKGFYSDSLLECGSWSWTKTPL